MLPWEGGRWRQESWEIWSTACYMQQGDLWRTGRKWMASTHDYPPASTSHMYTPPHTHRIYRQTIGGVRLAFTSYCDFRDNRPQPLFSKSINWESFLMREIPRTLGRRCRLHFVGFLAPSASPIQWNTRFYSLQLCHWLFLLLPSPSPGRESRPLLTWLRFISTKGWLLTKACYKENHEIVFMMKDLPKGCCLFLKCC